MEDMVLRRVVRLIRAGATFAVLAAQARVDTRDVMALVAGEPIDQQAMARIEHATARLAPVDT